MRRYLVSSILLSCVALGTHAAPQLPAPSELPASAAPPEALRMRDGREVTGRRMWERERRPELARLFTHYMYGGAPPAPRIKATVDYENPRALGGKATLREVSLQLEAPGVTDLRPIRLLVALPNEAAGPVPAFLGLSFVGNQAVLPDPGIRLSDAWSRPGSPGVTDNRATEASRGTATDTWQIEDSIRRGYAVAVFYYGDVEPDRPDAPDGVRARYAAAGKKYDWGAVHAWAWGLSRAMDYLATLPQVDRKRVVAVGHSRNGKAALLAAAMDPRFAAVIPLQAGCGGTAPSRGTVGESVKQINDRFPHWFNSRFKEFSTRTEQLPFDQHALIAMVAPRPVLLPNATEDTWANPEGQFRMLQLAEPVYQLYGKGLDAKVMPSVGRLVDSPLGYFIRPGKHSMSRTDWEAFWSFADRHLKPG